MYIDIYIYIYTYTHMFIILPAGERSGDPGGV